MGVRGPAAQGQSGMTRPPRCVPASRTA